MPECKLQALAQVPLMPPLYRPPMKLPFNNKPRNKPPLPRLPVSPLLHNWPPTEPLLKPNFVWKMLELPLNKLPLNVPLMLRLRLKLLRIKPRPMLRRNNKLRLRPLKRKPMHKQKLRQTLKPRLKLMLRRRNIARFQAEFKVRMRLLSSRPMTSSR